MINSIVIESYSSNSSLGVGVNSKRLMLVDGIGVGVGKQVTL